MRHISRELLAYAAAAIVIAVMVTMIGLTLTPAPLPPHHQDTTWDETGSDGPNVCLEATVTALRNQGIVGRGALCSSHSGFRSAVQVSGLTPGQPYTAWLGYTPPEQVDRPTSSTVSEPPGGDPNGPLRLLGQQQIAPAAGMLEFSGEYPGPRLTPQTRVSILLLQPGGHPGPHAQVVFVVP